MYHEQVALLDAARHCHCHPTRPTICRVGPSCDRIDRVRNRQPSVAQPQPKDLPPPATRETPPAAGRRDIPAVPVEHTHRWNLKTNEEMRARIEEAHRPIPTH